MPALMFTLLLPGANRSPACPPPAPQSEQGSARDLKLTAAEAKDSYAIYSMLLRTEMPPELHATAWAVAQETQVFSDLDSASIIASISECLTIPRDRKSIYQPLIQDYAAKNKKRLLLERKFDLPRYELVGWTSGELPSGGSVIFQVSAVGFNQKGTRALVHVSHYCGTQCGGGRYHLLLKNHGQWQVDRDYRGDSCAYIK